MIYPVTTKLHLNVRKCPKTVKDIFSVLQKRHFNSLTVEISRLVILNTLKTCIWVGFALCTRALSNNWMDFKCLLVAWYKKYSYYKVYLDISIKQGKQNGSYNFESFVTNKEKYLKA